MAVRFHIVPVRYHIGLHSPVDWRQLSVDLQLLFSQCSSLSIPLRLLFWQILSSEGSTWTKDGCLPKRGKSSGDEYYVIMSKTRS
jgi:hypothetical protein